MGVEHPPRLPKTHTKLDRSKKRKTGSPVKIECNRVDKVLTIDRDLDKNVLGSNKTLVHGNQTRVAVVDKKVYAQLAGSNIVYTAGPINNIPKYGH
mmetsp:Transcript_18257/g.40385  ORF Transcript_18257/g.40385 Transcript_18257/m.40385 type:complete len:96 (+) Transcript_18257:711-998(+)